MKKVVAKKVEIFSRGAKGAFFRGAYPIFQKNIFKATSSTELIKGCDSFVKYGQWPSIIAKDIDYKLINKKVVSFLNLALSVSAVFVGQSSPF